ncbi:MAG: sulfatase-like hydrolase/transferase [Saprospiraceae bacterium]|nr:sulfatase-like hydrolase/transferase [Saprospiraceae bacterium]
MSIVDLKKYIGLLLLLLCSIFSKAQQRPNVILIYSDDQGAIDLNCYGSKDLETPHIDKLARSGVMFTQFYASPVCSPSRASLLTGMTPQRAGFFYWNGPNKHDLFRNGVEVYYPGQYFPDLMVQEASTYMAQAKKDPFFMYFAINMPHYPYQGDPKWLEYYNAKGVPYPRNLYAAFMSTLDDKIGQLLDKVSELGLMENTINLFQSDNGYSTEERAHFGGGNAGIYRGAKACLFEGGIRVPSMISWPGQIPANQVRDQFAVNTDWMPTLAQLCNVPLDDNKLDGKSLVHVIKNQTASSPHEEGYCWAFGKDMWAARNGKWKLLGNPVDKSNKGELTKDDALFLVDLESDPGEMKNISKLYPEKVEELNKQYQQWLSHNKNK